MSPTSPSDADTAPSRTELLVSTLRAGGVLGSRLPSLDSNAFLCVPAAPSGSRGARSLLAVLCVGPLLAVLCVGPLLAVLCVDPSSHL
jgi:hypothetical protein